MERNADVAMLDGVARSARRGKDSIVFDVVAFIGLVIVLLTGRPELGKEVH